VALTLAYLAHTPPGASIAAGAGAAIVLGAAFLVHQWRTWMKVAAALPMAERK
jgi:hypothetical protein